MADGFLKAQLVGVLLKGSNGLDMMTSIFYAIAALFENVLFIPYNLLRSMDSWWLSNAINCLFILVGLAAGAYWMNELKKYKVANDDDTSNSAHSFL